jgi:hypothetical protein
MRSKRSIILSLITIASLFSMLLATAFVLGHASAANAAGASAGAGKASSSSPQVVPIRYAHSRGKAPVQAPNTSPSTSTDTHPILHNFDGISAPANEKVNGFDVEPPDQGLCVGNGFVMEAVNLVITIYRPNGTAVKGPVAMAQFFGEPQAFIGPDVNVQGDARCYFDPATHTWFATQLFLTTALTNNTSHFDVAVNPSGDPTTPWKVYRFDTTDLNNPGCPCFGDQPLLGIDQFNVYVSTNEFSILGPNFNGAQIYAISKSQLIAEASKVNFVHFGNLNIGGAIAASIEPAISVGSPPAEYFLNSLDPNGTFDHRIGVWAMTNRQLVSTGGQPTLSSTVITSETYGFPPLATDPSGFSINADDDRMLQVQYINGDLWSSLNTAITIPGDSSERVGAAWFEVQPSLNGNVIGSAKMLDQGYLASHGNYLMYPAVAAAPDGTAMMTMTLMGPSTFASAVFSVRPASTSHQDFTGIRLAAGGGAADHGFTCTDPATGNICRWGDYSAAVDDPSGTGIWMATEYIPGAGDASANWGTRVFEVGA